MGRLTQAAISALLLIVLAARPACAGPAEDLHALVEEYWANELRENPFAATSAGVNAYNRLAPGAAPEDYARRAAQAAAFLSRLNSIDVAAVSETERVSADILAFILKHDVALAPFKSWRIPFLADSGFHTAMTYAVRSTPFATAQDYADYIARLEAFAVYLDQNVANMRQGLADGFTQPKAILEGVLPSFDAQVTASAREHPLYEPFTRIPDSIPAKSRKALAARGHDAIASTVLPAFIRVRDFMRDEYALKAAEQIGASHLPEGEAYYAALVQFYTTRDDLTPAAVHDIGLREVARIRKDMNAVIKKTGFKGSFAEFQNFLRTDPQFYAKSAEELLMRTAWIAKDIDGRLPAFFGKLPRQPYSVEPVPAELAPNYTTGRYSGAPAGGARGGEYWINTYALDTRPLYELPALSLHEAVPGHHLQNALALEIENAPAFRAQFYPHAFGEGWGLYAEKLGVEMGVYTTPYEEFGRLSYEMWRACRLVIDTGVHAKGWSRDEAIDYLAANTALSQHNVTTEVDRYISWPGQALAYKIGELTLWELRARAERSLGDAFDIRAFHDAVLTEGGMPLDVLSRRIDDFIARERAGG